MLTRIFQLWSSLEAYHKQTVLIGAELDCTGSIESPRVLGFEARLFTAAHVEYVEINVNIDLSRGKYPVALDTERLLYEMTDSSLQVCL